MRPRLRQTPRQGGMRGRRTWTSWALTGLVATTLRAGAEELKGRCVARRALGRDFLNMAWMSRTTGRREGSMGVCRAAFTRGRHDELHSAPAHRNPVPGRNQSEPRDLSRPALTAPRSLDPSVPADAHVIRQIALSLVAFLGFRQHIYGIPYTELLYNIQDCKRLRYSTQRVIRSRLRLWLRARDVVRRRGCGGWRHPE